MRLVNKKTGEIRDFIINKGKIQTSNAVDCREYNALADLCAEWEDVPEHWYIDCDGEIVCPAEMLWESMREGMKNIGNYFATEAEAEEAAEKLKAFKRLKDKGFSFDHQTADDLIENYHEVVSGKGYDPQIDYIIRPQGRIQGKGLDNQAIADLLFLFGGGDD